MPGTYSASYAAYDDNRKRAADPQLEGSTVATLLFALAKLWVNWSCTTQKFYDRTTRAVKGHLGSDWPKSSSRFGAERRRIALSFACTGSRLIFERQREGTLVPLSVENGKAGGSKPSVTDP